MNNASFSIKKLSDEFGLASSLICYSALLALGRVLNDGGDGDGFCLKKNQ